MSDHTLEQIARTDVCQERGLLLPRHGLPCSHITDDAANLVNYFLRLDRPVCDCIWMGHQLLLVLLLIDS